MRLELNQENRHYVFDTNQKPELGKDVKNLLDKINIKQALSDNSKISIENINGKMKVKISDSGKEIVNEFAKGKASNIAFNLFKNAASYAKINAASDLSVVKKIMSGLSKKGNIMVFGAPSTGKTEQLQIALNRKVPIFDLRNKFCEEYSKDHNLKSEDVKKNYKNFKKEENEFIRNNKKDIVESLLKNPEDTIIIDEFDLGGGHRLNDDELSTAKMLIDMAATIKEKGKKVILIMHTEGLHTKELMQEIEQKLGMKHSDLVSTDFLPSQEAARLLEAIEFNPIEIRTFERLAMGLPAAYVDIIKSATPEEREKPTPKIGLDQLIQVAEKQVGKVYAVTKKTLSPEALKVFKDFALGAKTTQDPEVIKHKESLLETGLVKLIGEKLVVPPLVANVVSKEEAAEITPASRKQERKTEAKVNFREMDRHEKYEQIELEFYKKSANLYGGYEELVLHDKVFIKPKDPEAIEKAYKNKIQEIFKRISIDESIEHQRSSKNWANTAKSVDELLEATASLKEEYITSMRDLAAKNHGEAHFGPNDRFALKSKESLARKVETDMKDLQIPFEIALKNIGDGIRGTMVVNTPEDVRSLVAALQSEYKARGWDVSFKNIWETGRPGGYCGVHAKIYMSNNQGQKVIGELQIHLPQIYNGTLECVKESNHEVFEYAREAFGPTHKGEKTQPPKFATDISKLQFLSHIEEIR